MSQTLEPQAQLAPRPSSTLRSVHANRTQSEQVVQETPRLLRLPPEVRYLILSRLIFTERPFMIGRSQEKRRDFHGSPRDIYTFRPAQFKVRRDERRNRPVQPAIARVCRVLREEALPLWYAENEFWLIHNEFDPEDPIANPVTSPPRGFDAWLSQTPAVWFNLMQHVSICGYLDWPNRTMVSLDLKNRTLVGIRHYSTFGDELPVYCKSLAGLIEGVLSGSVDADGLGALKAVLEASRSLFQIQRKYLTTPPGMASREPASGCEYDW